MPKPTFFHLDTDKQLMIISSAMAEFSSKSYDSASVNTICKNANIPKGSFYQYFEDKLDVYLYLMSKGTEEKLKVFQSHVNTMQNLSLIEQIRQLFIVGIEFGDSHPQLAALANRLLYETNKQVQESVLEMTGKQTDDFYRQWIESAKLRGEVKEDISVDALSLMIQSLIQAVLNAQLQYYTLHQQPMHKETMLSLSHEMLTILSTGINPTITKGGYHENQ